MKTIHRPEAMDVHLSKGTKEMLIHVTNGLKTDVIQMMTAHKLAHIWTRKKTINQGPERPPGKTYIYI